MVTNVFQTCKERYALIMKLKLRFNTNKVEASKEPSYSFSQECLSVMDRARLGNANEGEIKTLLEAAREKDAGTHAHNVENYIIDQIELHLKQAGDLSNYKRYEWTNTGPGSQSLRPTPLGKLIESLRTRAGLDNPDHLITGNGWSVRITRK